MGLHDFNTAMLIHVKMLVEMLFIYCMDKLKLHYWRCRVRGGTGGVEERRGDGGDVKEGDRGGRQQGI